MPVLEQKQAVLEASEMYEDKKRKGRAALFPSCASLVP